MSTAKSFLQCLGLWTGKQSNFNQLQKKYVIPLKGNSAQRLKNISNDGLRKSFSLNSLDQLYKTDQEIESEPESETNQSIKTDPDRESDKAEAKEEWEKDGKTIGTDENSVGEEKIVESSIDANNDTVESFELELGEDVLVKDQPQSNENFNVKAAETDSSQTAQDLDDSLEDGEIVEDEVDTMAADNANDNDKDVSMADTTSEISPKDSSADQEESPLKMSADKNEETSDISKQEKVEKFEIEPKVEPKKEVKYKAFETKWPKIQKVERRKSLDCLELLAKEMICNDFLNTARAIRKMKIDEAIIPDRKPSMKTALKGEYGQEFKIEISKKESVPTSPSSSLSKPLQSSPRQFNPPAINFYPTVTPSTSKQSVGNSPTNLPSYKDATENRLKTGNKLDEKDTRICMVTPHVQKRSNSSQKSSPSTAKPKNNSRPPIIVLDDEKEPIHDLVEPQVPSPVVPISSIVPPQPSHLSFPRNRSNNIWYMTTYIYSAQMKICLNFKKQIWSSNWWLSASDSNSTSAFDRAGSTPSRSSWTIE